MTACPDNYDRGINGAPAWSLPHLFTWMAEIQKRYAPGSLGFISEAQSERANTEIISQCDIQDGLADGIIQVSRRCHFVPERLICNGTQLQINSTCFTSPQLLTLYHILNDWVDTNQTLVFYTLDLGTEYILANPIAAFFGLTFLQNFFRIQ